MASVREDFPNYDKYPITKISICKFCNQELMWIPSKRTGKRYPVNITRRENDEVLIRRNDFHQCKRPHGEVKRYYEQQ